MARKSSVTAASAALERLRAEGSEHRGRFIELAVAHTLALPLKDLVSVDDLVALVLEAIQEENVAFVVENVIIPGDARLRAHYAATEEKVGDIVPPEIAKEAVRLALSAERPKGDWIKGTIDTTPVRALLVPIVQETLLSFAKRLPIPGLSGDAPASPKEKSSGLFGAAVRLGTSTVAGVGKAALGGVTGELEKKVQALTKDFANQAITDARAAIRTRLKSPEGKRAIQSVTEQITKRVLETKLETLLQDSAGIPTDAFARLAPRLLEHNRHNPHLKTWIEAELRAILVLHGDEPVGDILEGYHLQEKVRAQLIEQLQAPVKSFVDSEAFGDWLSDLLSQ